MAMAMKSFALDQYLKTATGGNVFANHAVVTDRWQLVCQKCQKTMTFAESYDIADDYTNKGRLDHSVQQFAKEHLHLKPQLDTAGKVVTFAPTSDVNHEFDPSSGDWEIQTIKLGKVPYFTPVNPKYQKQTATVTGGVAGFAEKQSVSKWMLAYEKKKAEELQLLKKKLWEAENETLQPAPVPKPKREGRRFR